MKISVVTIVFNDAEHILNTINSVEEQTARQQIEYIVVDGASTDGTSELIQKQLSAIDTYICEKDSGIYNAMNKGLTAAKGDYVIFMNSGDKFSDDNVIGRVISSIPRSANLPILIYGNYRETGADTHTSGVKPSRKPDKIWYGPIASHQSTFYNLAFLREHNLFYDEEFKIAADYRLTLETLVKSNYNALQLDFCISDFDITGTSNINQNLGLKEANRIRREVLGWSSIRCAMLSAALLSARFCKAHVNWLYRLLRY